MTRPQDAAIGPTALAEPPRHDRAKLAEYRWLLEEFRVSLFAQELRTLTPVSAKRLEELARLARREAGRA